MTKHPAITVCLLHSIGGDLLYSLKALPTSTPEAGPKGSYKYSLLVCPPSMVVIGYPTTLVTVTGAVGVCLEQTIHLPHLGLLVICLRLPRCLPLPHASPQGRSGVVCGKMSLGINPPSNDSA
ncbi:hypothetical protein MLD38_011252 [Melastoma candidum]|uniref:Uncharacterized protein n=1 Tax=Melastoma candidum TaxID=119954 RepID=A0ACB9R2I6_9MYRT|nr:hypothetical protein MLD38_011252 [Melastoma candidum]